MLQSLGHGYLMLNDEKSSRNQAKANDGMAGSPEQVSVTCSSLLHSNQQSLTVQQTVHS